MTFRSQNRATIFYTLGRFETGVVEGRLGMRARPTFALETDIGTLMKTPQWRITWGSSKSLDPGAVPVVSYNGNGLVLETHRSSTSSSMPCRSTHLTPCLVIWCSIGRHVADSSGDGVGSMEFGSSHKWATGESPSLSFCGSKVAGVYVKNKGLR